MCSLFGGFVVRSHFSFQLVLVQFLRPSVIQNLLFGIYCAAEGDSATCSAQHVCVCKRAYFHPALDTALTAVANEYPGKFSVDEDEENTPLWTEPYWSSNVGVKVYRDSRTGPGFIALGVGVLASLWVFTFTRKIKASLQKEKVY